MGPHQAGSVALVLALALGSACRAPLEVAPVPEVVTPGGVVVQDLEEGLGPGARFGERIAIAYVAQLDDGTTVDSSYDRGLPVMVELGSASLAGWNEGLLGLAEGGRRQLVVPPELAYGEEGVPGMVPPDATLVFVVERVPLAELEPSTPAPDAAE